LIETQREIAIIQFVLVSGSEGRNVKQVKRFLNGHGQGSKTAVAFKLNHRANATDQLHLVFRASGLQHQLALPNQMNLFACEARLSLRIEMVDAQSLILADLSYYYVHPEYGSSQI
jgi:hypothetical protein